MSVMSRRERGTDLPRRFPAMDGMFEEWLRSLPMRRPFGLGWDWPGEDLIRVDEFRDGDTEVIRAEPRGVDPAQDVEVTVADGVLRIKAERRVDEMRYGSLTRTLPLPENVQDGDISATFRDGILKIRVPVPEQAEKSEPTRIEITT